MSDQPASTDRYKNFTVLIVDDQEAVRDSVRLMLRALGFGAITEAANGEAAKEQFLTRVPDLMKAKDLSVDGFLVKPVANADLTVRVDRAMRVYSR